jgi:HEAT repeat protein
VVTQLVPLTLDADREIAQASQETLASLRDPIVDTAVMNMLKSGDQKQRLVGIELTGRRRMASAVPVLLKATQDADASVRSAAIKKFGELGSPSQLPDAVNLITHAQIPSELDVAEQAASAIGGRAENPASCAKYITAILTGLPSEPKSALLRVLGSIGGPDALKAVRQAVLDSPDVVRAAAIRVLGEWKTADAAPDLLELARTTSNATDKTLCLRSYLGVAANSDVPAEQRLDMCRQAGGLVERNEEVTLLLAALSNINKPESLSLILPYLDRAANKDEAVTAALAISDKILRSEDAAKLAPKLVEPLQRVAQSGAKTELINRAQSLLQQAQSKSTAK